MAQQQAPMHDVACDFCGGTEADILHTPRRPVEDVAALLAVSSNVSGTQTVVRCRGCGLVRVSPRIDATALGVAVQGAESGDYLSQVEQRERTFGHSLDLLEGVQVQGGGKRILDVGCASGNFLRVAAARGWEARGVEPNESLATFARERYGLDVHCGVLADVPDGPATLDAITFWDVLEHVTDPDAHIRMAARLLKPGGLLAVNYPNYDSVFARILGDRWWYMVPVHLHYFTPAVLRRQFERHGLEVVHEGRHWQTLELGHVATMGSGLAPRLLCPVAAWLRGSRLGRLPFSYHAGQWTMVARLKG